MWRERIIALSAASGGCWDATALNGLVHVFANRWVAAEICGRNIGLMAMSYCLRAMRAGGRLRLGCALKRSVGRIRHLCRHRHRVRKIPDGGFAISGLRLIVPVSGGKIVQSVDVAIIVGGGMVGLAHRLRLAGSSFARCGTLDTRCHSRWRTMRRLIRVSINAANEKLLTRLGVVQYCGAAGGVIPRYGSLGPKTLWRITFDDASMGYSHLGHIGENSVIHYALWQKAQQAADITLMAPAELQQVARGRATPS